MKKKILWMLLSFLLVAALVLASCAKEEVVGEQEEEEEEEEEEPVGEQEEEEEEEVVPAVGEPIYGGTVTHFLWAFQSSIADHAVDGWPAMQYTSPVIEFLIMGDAEKYGARGTGEYSFTTDPPPVGYSKGAIAESWEITPDRDKLIFHIRPGIIWAAYGKEHVMEPRELTAEDVAWSLNRSLDGPMMAGWLRTENGGWIDSIYAEDDTVVVEGEFIPFSINWVNLAHGWAMGIYAPEVVEAGASDWDNLVGTGPFMFKEHVVGSHISYERNPNYWDTTTIDGVEYDDIPFIDELVYTQAPDESTRIAALRTGVIDVIYTVELVYGDTLAQTSPELIQQNWEMERMEYIAMRCDRPPFDNKEVRRAMMIALNLPAISRARYGEWNLRGWPAAASTAAYTPFDELPAHIQELYDYNPDLARDMIADIYPDGITGVEIILPNYPGAIDNMQMAIAYWADIGVEATMKVMEWGAYAAAVDAGEYDCITEGAQTWDVLAVLGGYFTPDNEAYYDNPEFTERFLEAKEKRTEDEQNAILKELAITALDSVAYIPLHVDGIGICAWWPWLKNFYGEFAIGAWGPSYALSTAWIDQDLKAEMGY